MVRPYGQRRIAASGLCGPASLFLSEGWGKIPFGGTFAACPTQGQHPGCNVKRGLSIIRFGPGGAAGPKADNDEKI
jgi:hypothetical protein